MPGGVAVAPVAGALEVAAAPVPEAVAEATTPPAAAVAAAAAELAGALEVAGLWAQHSNRRHAARKSATVNNNALQHAAMHTATHIHKRTLTNTRTNAHHLGYHLAIVHLALVFPVPTVDLLFQIVLILSRIVTHCQWDIGLLDYQI